MPQVRQRRRRNTAPAVGLPDPQSWTAALQRNQRALPASRFMQLAVNDHAHFGAEAFRASIGAVPFPCAGARFTRSQWRLSLVNARDIRSGRDDMRIRPTPPDFGADCRTPPGSIRSFAVVFEGPGVLDVAALEKRSWPRSRSLARHGETSEARQDSDQGVGGEWRCRSRRRPGTPPDAAVPSQHAPPFDQPFPVGRARLSAQIGE